MGEEGPAWTLHQPLWFHKDCRCFSAWGRLTSAQVGYRAKTKRLLGSTLFFQGLNLRRHYSTSCRGPGTWQAPSLPGTGADRHCLWRRSRPHICACSREDLVFPPRVMSSSEAHIFQAVQSLLKLMSQWINSALQLCLGSRHFTRIPHVLSQILTAASCEVSPFAFEETEA